MLTSTAPGIAAISSRVCVGQPCPAWQTAPPRPAAAAPARRAFARCAPRARRRRHRHRRRYEFDGGRADSRGRLDLPRIRLDEDRDLIPAPASRETASRQAAPAAMTSSPPSVVSSWRFPARCSRPRGRSAGDRPSPRSPPFRNSAGSRLRRRCVPGHGRGCPASSRRCTVMPIGPGADRRAPAWTGQGKLPRRAFRRVATSSTSADRRIGQSCGGVPAIGGDLGGSRIEAMRLPGSAWPVPAIPSAVPWSGWCGRSTGRGPHPPAGHVERLDRDRASS